MAASLRGWASMFEPGAQPTVRTDDGCFLCAGIAAALSALARALTWNIGERRLKPGARGDPQFEI